MQSTEDSRRFCSYLWKRVDRRAEEGVSHELDATNSQLTTCRTGDSCSYMSKHNGSQLPGSNSIRLETCLNHISRLRPAAFRVTSHHSRSCQALAHHERGVASTPLQPMHESLFFSRDQQANIRISVPYKRACPAFSRLMGLSANTTAVAIARSLPDVSSQTPHSLIQP